MTVLSLFSFAKFAIKCVSKRILEISQYWQTYRQEFGVKLL